MELKEKQPTFELKYSCLKLPDKQKANSPKNKGKTTNKDINEIKNLLKDMKINQHRTINFQTILYFEENSFEKISLDKIRAKLRNEYILDKSLLVNSITNKPFTSEANLQKGINCSLLRNKAFIIQTINNQKYVSLNECKALDYLKKMKKKYTINVCGDITSMASLDNQHNKIDDINKFITTNSERKSMSKNFIGNKRLKSSNSIDDETLTEQQKINIELLKKNLSGKKKDFPKNDQKEKITDFFEHNEPKIFVQSDNTIFYLEIDKLIETLDKNEKVISSYKKKFDQLKTSIDAKNKIVQEYENEMEKIAAQQKKLNAIYEAMKLKLLNIQSTKKKKYYGEFFEKSKKISSIYKEIFDKNVECYFSNTSQN